MVYFDTAEVLVNGTGILADTISFRTKNSLIPIYSIGKKGTESQVIDGPVETQISFSYYMDLGSEPVFPLLDTVKNLTGAYYSGVTISAANVTGFRCYLTNYELTSTPNTLVKVNAQFISFEDVTGVIQARNTTPPNSFTGRLAMGWTTHVVSGNSYLTAPIYNFSYNFTVAWDPIYVLGQRKPIQIDMIEGTESFVFLRDNYQVIRFTGEETVQPSTNALINSNNIDTLVNFYGYNYIANTGLVTPTLVINLSGSKIHMSDFDVGLDDFAKNLTTCYKYF